MNEMSSDDNFSCKSRRLSMILAMSKFTLKSFSPTEAAISEIPAMPLDEVFKPIPTTKWLIVWLSRLVIPSVKIPQTFLSPKNRSLTHLISH